MREQKPINSGFHAKSEAAEIVAMQKLQGKNIIVTGGYSGIGLETTRALAAVGAHVIVPARRAKAAQEAVAAMEGKISVAAMDLADLNAVKKFADDFNSDFGKLDILINNAGIMACPETRIGPQKWEQQFAVNHLGHMVLTTALKPSLLKGEGATNSGPRVVCLSSTAHAMSDVHWDDPHFHNHDYDKWQAYGQAKSANALFALGVDEKWQAEGIRGFGVHPGGIMTPLQRHLETEEMVALGWMNPDGSMPPHIKALFKTPSQGASTTLFAATSAKLDHIGGVYCEDADVAQLATADSQRWEHAREHITDVEKAMRLWEMSEAMLSV